MKSRIRLIAIVAGAAVLLTVLTLVIINVTSCNHNTTVTLTAEKARQMYDSALQSALSAENFTLDITTTKNTTTDENTYSFSTQQTVKYSGFGTDSMLAQSKETMTVGQKETVITESFADNKAYFTVDGATFTSAMTQDVFVDRFAPVAPINAAIYRSVSGAKSREGTTIQFSEPIAAEQWCIGAEATLRSASGLVQLDADGQLLRSDYSIEYSQGTVTVNLAITVAFIPSIDTQISVPISAKNTSVPYLDAARDLEILYGNLLQSGKVYAQAREVISCQASGIQRTQKTVMDMDNSEAGLNATIDTAIDIVDYNNGGDTTGYTQLETFKNGVYTISADGGEASEQADVTAAQMLSYCQDFLVKNIILPENIATVNTVTDGNVVTVQIVGTEELALLICKNVSKTLYDDPELLANLASSYKTNQINCYYKFDKATNLPLSAGLDYSGEHTIEGFAYTLIYNAEILYEKPAETPETQPEDTTPPLTAEVLFIYVITLISALRHQ